VQSLISPGSAREERVCDYLHLGPSISLWRHRDSPHDAGVPPRPRYMTFRTETQFVYFANGNIFAIPYLCCTKPNISYLFVLYLSHPDVHERQYTLIILCLRRDPHRDKYNAKGAVRFGGNTGPYTEHAISETMKSSMRVNAGRGSVSASPRVPSESALGRHTRLDTPDHVRLQPLAVFHRNTIPRMEDFWAWKPMSRNMPEPTQRIQGTSASK